MFGIFEEFLLFCMQLCKESFVAAYVIGTFALKVIIML